MTKRYLKILTAVFILMLAGRYTFSERMPSEFRIEGSLELIEKAYISGEITRGDKIFYDLQAIREPQALPADYKSDVTQPVRSGTPYINDVRDNWDLLTPEQRVAAAAYFNRPPAHPFYVSPDSFFMIHYDTTGSNTVSPEDLDSNNIPDYVERIGLYADSSYRFYHNGLGYLPPPADGDSFYDIYIRFTGLAYGSTFKESPGDSSWGDYSSYMEIHNTMSIASPNEDPEGAVIGALKITCAHEYFHATQMAYAFKSGPDIWWTEGSATFMEDIVFDVVNDNYIFLPYFFNYPDTFLIDTSIFGASWHDYSTFIWPTFLTEKYGLDIIRTIWEYLRFYDPLPSMDSALHPFGEKVETALPEFMVWNYFTGDRDTPDYYEEGAGYPHVHIDHQIASYPFSGDTAIDPPDGLASNYIVAYPGTVENGLLKLDFDGIDIVRWGFSYIVFDNDSSRAVINCDVDNDGKTRCGIYNDIRYDSIVFIPCVVTQWQDDNDYVFDSEVYPFGDADGNAEINIFDVTHIIGFLYLNGPEPRYDLMIGDANCDGAVNLFDATYLITFLYLGGPEPCPDGP